MPKGIPIGVNDDTFYQERNLDGTELTCRHLHKSPSAAWYCYDAQATLKRNKKIWETAHIQATDDGGVIWRPLNQKELWNWLD